MARRTIPVSTREAVVTAMEGGASARKAANDAGVDLGTAIHYWRNAYGQIPWPAQHRIKAPLRYIGAVQMNVVVVDYECPCCGAIIHHAVIDTKKPFHCPWCGKEVG